MAFDWQSVLFGALITGGVSALGYFGKGILPSERRKAKADEYAALATIAATMKEKNLSHEDVQGLAAVLRGEKRRARVESILADVKSESKVAAEMQVDEDWTQAAMNERAGINFRKSQIKLEETAMKYKRLLDPEEEMAFHRVQDAWQEYCDRQAEFAASEYAGGSMAPLVFSSEKEVITEARARELEAAYKERAERQSGGAE